MENVALNFEDRIASTSDATVRYTFSSLREAGTLPVSISYCNRDDGKRILCVPTHSNGLELTAEELTDAIKAVWAQVPAHVVDPRLPYLISFLGDPDPLDNWRSVVRTMDKVRTWATLSGFPVRFSISTALPDTGSEDFIPFASFVQKLDLNVKVNFTPVIGADAHVISSSANVAALNLLQWYHQHTGQAIELHYTPTAGLNDGTDHIFQLERVLAGKNIPLKLLEYPLTAPSEEWMSFFVCSLACSGIATERYTLSEDKGGE